MMTIAVCSMHAIAAVLCFRLHPTMKGVTLKRQGLQWGLHPGL